MNNKAIWLFAIIIFTISTVFSIVAYAVEEDVGTTPSTGDTSGDIGGEYSRFKNFNVTLLDFSTYEDRNKEVFALEKNPDLEYLKDTPAEEQPINKPQTGEVFSKDGDPLYQISQYDMRIKNWVVDLNSSADNIINRYYSYCKKIIMGKEPKLTETGKIVYTEDGEMEYEDSKVQPIQYKDATTEQIALGARIHFPNHDFNAHAVIHPLFEFAVYSTMGKLVNLGNGVMDNVGKIRQIVVNAAGRKYPHSLAVRLRDHLGNVSEYFVGYLKFNNWRQLKWDNPYYFPEIDHPTHLFQVPLYPRERPHIKFDSFVIRRFGGHVGGDFVVYFKKIKMSFDFAVPPEDSTDINDEAYWGILKAVYDKRRRHQLKKAREIIENLREETAKKGQNLIFGDHPIRFK